MIYIHKKAHHPANWALDLSQEARTIFCLAPRLQLNYSSFKSGTNSLTILITSGAVLAFSAR